MEQDLDIYLVRIDNTICLMCEDTFKKLYGFSPADNGFFYYEGIAVSVRYYNSLLDSTFQNGGTWNK